MGPVRALPGPSKLRKSAGNSEILIQKKVRSLDDIKKADQDLACLIHSSISFHDEAFGNFGKGWFKLRLEREISHAMAWIEEGLKKNMLHENQPELYLFQLKKSIERRFWDEVKKVDFALHII